MSGNVSVRSVSKSYGTPVVSDMSLDVKVGEAVGIVGPNGAGKTTLLKLMAGDVPVDSGSIFLGGVDVTTMGSDQRCRAGLGRTSQVPRPFEGLTVLENVLVGATFGHPSKLSQSERLELSMDVLERTGMADKANMKAGALALLDRKRLELSRALSTQPSVLLLDEIAGGLTEQEVGELVVLIKQINSDGTTLIWIEHLVQALLKVVGKIMAMSFGVKIAEGDPHTVMNSAEVQEVYLGIEP